jgi:lipid A ethanolaminephosphotransferase
LKKITQTQLLVLAALFLVLFDNYTFFVNLVKVYPLASNFGFVISTSVVILFFTILLFSLISFRYTIKPVLIIILLISSLTNYFMNSYSVIIDDSMIRNMMQTNIHESTDLLTLKQVAYFVFLGVLPSLYIYKVKIEKRTFKTELISRIKLIAIALVMIIGSIFIFSKYYTSFAREHKPLRYTVNPAYWIYSTGKYINKTFNSGKIVLKPIGLDAKIVNKSEDNRSKLIFMVVGEAARADHFSLDGYQRDTNPLLEKDDIINFSNMSSCGTSTAESVPCMFSMYDRSDYNYKKRNKHRKCTRCTQTYKKCSYALER